MWSMFDQLGKGNWTYGLRQCMLFQNLNRNITHHISNIISLFQLMCKLSEWNATNFVQNVAYVEQKQQKILNEYGARYYEFLLYDYSESLELFEVDLKRFNGLSSYSISRVMSLMRIIYGNRTEIETGLVNNWTEIKLLSKIFNAIIYSFSIIYMLLHLLDMCNEINLHIFDNLKF